MRISRPVFRIALAVLLLIVALIFCMIAIAERGSLQLEDVDLTWEETQGR